MLVIGTLSRVLSAIISGWGTGLAWNFFLKASRFGDFVRGFVAGAFEGAPHVPTG